MNRDTLYGSVVIDTEGGAQITVPKAEDGRCVSVLVLNNDRYAPAVYYEPGTYDLPTDTRYVTLLYPVQLLDYLHPDDVVTANALQDQRIGPGKLDTVVSEIFLGLSGRQIRRDLVEVHRIRGASVQCAMSAPGIVKGEIASEPGSEFRRGLVGA